MGIDIVDLSDEWAKSKVNDPRFLARVFTQPEQKLIHESKKPVLTLWQLWAAKEAAYKAFCAKVDHVVFEHRKFEVKKLEAKQGRVAYRRQSVFVSWKNSPQHVVAVCILNKNFRNIRTKIWIEKIWDKEPSRQRQSQDIRIWAKRNLESSGIKNFKISPASLNSNRLSGPPFLIESDSSRSKHRSISFSHDGCFAAMAYAISKSKISV